MRRYAAECRAQIRIEGLQSTLAGAGQKLAQVGRRAAAAVDLGVPGRDLIAGRAGNNGALRIAGRAYRLPTRHQVPHVTGVVRDISTTTCGSCATVVVNLSVCPSMRWLAAEERVVSNVVVVGAGIVGSVAYHLVRHGVPVTLIEQASSPAAGVTGSSFAWIGDSAGVWPGGAQDLRGSVLMDYRRLEAELPGMAVRWTGSLAWTDSSTRIGNGTRLGRGQHWVTRGEIAALEPNLRSPPERAVHTPTDGSVDPLRMTQALVQAASTLGARVILGSAATSLKIVRGHAEGVLSSAGFHPASTVVLAAGTNIPQLCEPLGVKLPVDASPAFLMRVAAPPGLVRTIVASPQFEARELRDGHLLMTAPHTPGLNATGLQQLAHRTLEHLHTTFGSDEPLTYSSTV